MVAAFAATPFNLLIERKPGARRLARPRNESNDAAPFVSFFKHGATMSELRSRKVLTLDQLAALGSIAAESSYTEVLVDDLIVMLSGAKRQKAEILIGSKMMEGKFALLCELGLLKLRSEERKTEFKKIIGKLRHANTDRVAAIHGVWREGPQGILATDEERVPKAVHKKNKNNPLPATRLDKIAEAISDSHKELFQFAVTPWIKPRLPPEVRARLFPPRPRG